jgi:hypothetical protein
LTCPISCIIIHGGEINLNININIKNHFRSWSTHEVDSSTLSNLAMIAWIRNHSLSEFEPWWRPGIFTFTKFWLWSENWGWKAECSTLDIARCQTKSLYHGKPMPDLYSASPCFSQTITNSQFSIFLSITITSKIFESKYLGCWIWGSHSNGYGQYYFLKYNDSIISHRIELFRHLGYLTTETNTLYILAINGK